MSNCRFLPVCLATLFCLMFFPGMSQQKDACFWISVNLEKKLAPAWSLLFTEELRMNENITEIGEVFSDIGFEYRISKKWKAGLFYRFSNQRRIDDSYKTKHRYYADLTYKEKIARFSIILRGRFQSQYTEINSSEEGHVPSNHLNGKITLKYNLNKKIKPYLASEFFFRLNKMVYGSFDQLRVTAGIEYSVNRRNQLDLFYRINKEYNVKSPETDFICGVSYYFIF